MKISLLEVNSKKVAVVLFSIQQVSISSWNQFSGFFLGNRNRFKRSLQTFDYKNSTILDMVRPNANAAKSLKFTILGFIVWLLLATTVKADMSIESALKGICSVKLVLLYQNSTVCTFAVSDSGKVSDFQFHSVDQNWMTVVIPL